MPIKRLITRLEKIYKESEVKGKKLPAGANAVLKSIGQEILKIDKDDRDFTAKNIY